jgi:hypothetical protein
VKSTDARKRFQVEISVAPNLRAFCSSSLLLGHLEQAIAGCDRVRPSLHL